MQVTYNIGTTGGATGQIASMTRVDGSVVNYQFSANRVMTCETQTQFLSPGAERNIEFDPALIIGAAAERVVDLAAIVVAGVDQIGRTEGRARVWQDG